MRDFVDRWLTGLAGLRPRVVLTDGDDPRVMEAADRLARTTPITPVLLSDVADAGGGVDILRPGARTDPRIGRAFEEALADRPAGERAQLAGDPLYVGAAALRAGLADACVGGSARPTADVIRAGIRLVGLAPDTRAVTSCFLMALLDGRVVAYADCAVVPEPDEAQLAEIALTTSRTFSGLTDQLPAVAMLSFSTKGSADHPLVQRVRAATELVRTREPNLVVDGELQFDAAFVEAVGAHKAAGSTVAGHANVFVFPSLDAGNIAYKITERLAHAAAIGPILQGLSAPVNDLSRGCSVDDVVTVALVSAVQAARTGPPPRSTPVLDTSAEV